MICFQVTAIISLPRHPNDVKTLRIPYSSPYQIDRAWRRKKLIGWAMDRFVGFWWSLLILIGLGKDARLVLLFLRIFIQRIDRRLWL